MDNSLYTSLSKVINTCNLLKNPMRKEKIASFASWFESVLKLVEIRGGDF